MHQRETQHLCPEIHSVTNPPSMRDNQNVNQDQNAGNMSNEELQADFAKNPSNPIRSNKRPRILKRGALNTGNHRQEISNEVSNRQRQPRDPNEMQGYPNKEKVPIIGELYQKRTDDISSDKQNDIAASRQGGDELT